MAWFMLSLNVCCSCSMSSEVNKCTKNMLSRFKFGLRCSESKVVWPVHQLSLSHRYSIVTSLLTHITARLCHRQSGARKALQLPRSLLASHTHNIHLSIGIRRGSKLPRKRSQKKSWISAFVELVLLKYKWKETSVAIEKLNFSAQSARHHNTEQLLRK